MTNEKIARINELAKKSKTTGLTDAEKAEQKKREEILFSQLSTGRSSS